MNPKELIDRLRTDAEWAEGQEWETPICLQDDLRNAAAALTTLTEENAQLQGDLANYKQVTEWLGRNGFESFDALIEAFEQVKRERDAAMKETERMKSIMRERGIMVIPSKYPGGKSEWNVPPRGPQKEERAMALKIIACPWCGKEARITYEENRLYQMKCYNCRNTMLHEDRSFDKAVEFFEHHVGLVQAEKDSIPKCGTKVFVLTTAEYWSKKYAKPEIIECVVTTHRLRKTGQITFSVDGRWNSGSYYKAVFVKASIGKTVFRAREEAEAALSAQKGGTE